MGESKLQLVNRLIDSFSRVNGAEMPVRVLMPPRTDGRRSRIRSAEGTEWAAHPVLLLAVDGPAVLRWEGHQPIELRIGDAIFMSGRDLLKLQPGGEGTVIGFEALGTQPCRFFVAEGQDPWSKREDLEMFCMPVATDLPGCWLALHEAFCLLESALQQVKESSNFSEPTLRSVLRLVLTECGRGLGILRGVVDRPVDKSNSARVAAADLYVSCNIGRDIRKVELAKFLGVSVSQLTLAFRDFGQLAVRDRVRFRRVESARNLLSDTSLSVAEVAEKVGMNYRHFIRAFRQTTSLTPLRFRKIARRKEKSAELWKELLFTANFNEVKPVWSVSDALPIQHQVIADGAVSILISNATAGILQVSRLSALGEFVTLGKVVAEKRLSFLDVPGSLWKMEAHDSSGAHEPIFFKVENFNSHFIVGVPTE